MSLSKKALVAAFMALIVMSLAVIPGLAQSVVTAEVDRTQLSTDESLILSIRYAAGNGTPSTPVLPAFDGFRLDGSSSGRTISINNGNMTTEVTNHFRLTPTRPGDLVIGPVMVEINGQEYYTNSIEITVTQGTGQPQPQTGVNPVLPSLPGFQNMPGFGNFPSLPDWLFAPPGSSQPSAPVAPGQPAPSLDPAALPANLTGQDLFVDAVVDKPTPYQGEGLTYTFRFFQAVELFGQPEYSSPTFTGFWHEQVGEPVVYAVDAAGRTYRVTEIQTSLYPTVVGNIMIEPASINTPDSFFQSGHFLETLPVELNVQPLPPNSPVGFMGAVGQYDLSSEVDKTATEVNDTVTLKVTLSGVGNLETVPDPTWNEGPEWRAFETQAAVDTWIEDGQRMGTRTYERTLVPTTPGELILPAVEYVYFNPETATYETARTEPITIQVAPDANAPLPDGANDADPGSTVGLTAPDGAGQLKANKQAVQAAGGVQPPLPQQAGYWLLWALPVVFLVGQFTWQASKKRRLANPAARRSQGAAKKAKQAMRSARKNNTGADQASIILMTYLEDKFDRSVSGLTEDNLASLLHEKDLEAGLIDRITDFLRQSELSRYAPEDPTGGSNREQLDEAGRLINDLEKSLK